MQTNQKTVIVAGGGYAGVLAANRVHSRMHGRVRVLLVTPDAQLTERIRLHQLAVHGSDIQQPYARLLAPGIEHVAARVEDVAPGRNTVAIDDGGGLRWLEYNALILALGSDLTTQVPMASQLSAALRDVAHARQLSRALPKLAHGERVAVVGGGLSAIELASEIAEAFPHLSVELLAQRVGENLDEPSRRALIEELEALHVHVRENVRVRALEHHGVALQDGSHVPATLSVLACGFEPTPLPAASALPHASDGRVSVDAQLRVPGTENVFAVGDFAAPPPETVGSGLRTTRMGCVNAMPLGAHAADQVARLLQGQPLAPFHTSYMLQCISIGRRRGLVIFVDRDDRPSGRIVRGRLGAVIKELICRFVIGGIRLERHFAGAYAWPEQHRPAMLSKNLEQLTP